MALNSGSAGKSGHAMVANVLPCTAMKLSCSSDATKKLWVRVDALCAVVHEHQTREELLVISCPVQYVRRREDIFRRKGSRLGLVQEPGLELRLRHVAHGLDDRSLLLLDGTPRVAGTLLLRREELLQVVCCAGLDDGSGERRDESSLRIGWIGHLVKL